MLFVATNLKVTWQRIRDRINLDAVLCNQNGNFEFISEGLCYSSGVTKPGHVRCVSYIFPNSVTIATWYVWCREKASASACTQK